MLSVIIICKNEAHNIERCLKSVHFADEIIVLDSGSTDDTVTIAKKYTDKVYVTDWPGYGKQKQRALEKATGNWILNLDADESVPLELQREMMTKMATEDIDAFRIPIQMNFYGQPLKYSSSPERHVRLFRNGNARYSDDIVHEKIVLADGAKIGQMGHKIQHHSFKDVSHALYKINKYSSYSAKIRIEQHKKPSMGKTLLSTSWMFIRCYLIQRGFLDGKAGFLFAVFNAQGAFYRGIKQVYPDKDIDKLPSTAQTKRD